ncbi:uncharacterized protein FOMMEDRAFT_153974 [Fomitiporia mediterranea MF3/22]|uniref:uncharacterized protein n=1 Tax=Fomitiporia mediterranea (strain MF3/22) TaxID=694068 RepID=UPI0004408C70|nr:uncharacterized protein FOMMEDRAFT_153974 [Fomitiporia mediterranea MF3/22]EJD04847.1 hypothetical protein FOMMEDRAFT_153974 [Fomitiporia mediterranea MF3/22]
MTFEHVTHSTYVAPNACFLSIRTTWVSSLGLHPADHHWLVKIRSCQTAPPPSSDKISCRSHVHILWFLVVLALLERCEYFVSAIPPIWKVWTVGVFASICRISGWCEHQKDGTHRRTMRLGTSPPTSQLLIDSLVNLLISETPMNISHKLFTNVSCGGSLVICSHITAYLLKLVLDDERKPFNAPVRLLELRSLPDVTARQKTKCAAVSLGHLRVVSRHWGLFLIPYEACTE